MFERFKTKRLPQAPVAAAIEAEHVRHAALVTGVRCAGLTLFVALFSILGEAMGRPEWHANWGFLLPYWVFSCAAWASRQHRLGQRFLGWSIALVDIPAVFALQFLSLHTSTSPGGVAGFTLSLFAMLTFLVALTHYRIELVAAVVVSNLCEAYLQTAAGLGIGACLAASIVLWLIGAIGRYAGERMRLLALDVYKKANEHAHAYRELSDFHKNFRALIDGMHDVVIAYHNDEIIYANKAALSLCGYDSIDSVMGAELTKMVEQVPPDVGPYNTFETTLVSGGPEPVTIDALKMRSPMMGVDADVIIGRDVSERKAAMKQMAVNERMVTMGMLAAGVAHEINNPLAAVMGHLNLMGEGAREQRSRTQGMLFGDGRQRLVKSKEDILAFTTEHLEREPRHELHNLLTPLFVALDFTIEYEITFRDQYLADLTESVERATRAANHVSTVSQNLKNLAAPQDQKPAPIAVQPILDNVVGMMLHIVRGRAHVTCSSAGGAWVHGHGSGLVQVLLNLVINAWHAVASTPQKEISISMEEVDDERVVLMVRDTGVGMSLDIQKKLFSAFFTTKPAGVGTGLGLSMSKKIVESMGGRLWFESYSDVGTTFFIELRRAPAQEASPSPSPETSGEATLSSMRHRGRVLVVDDNDMVADVVRRALSLENEVTVCTSPAEALDRIKDEAPYDAIVCDVVMPQMNGLQMHGCVSEIDQGLADRMVFVSGSVYEGEMYLALRNLPNELLSKPFELSAIREAVRRCANHRRE